MSSRLILGEFFRSYFHPLFDFLKLPVRTCIVSGLSIIMVIRPGMLESTADGQPEDSQ